MRLEKYLNATYALIYAWRLFLQGFRKPYLEIEMPSSAKILFFGCIILAFLPSALNSSRSISGDEFEGFEMPLSCDDSSVIRLYASKFQRIFMSCDSLREELLDLLRTPSRANNEHLDVGFRWSFTRDFLLADHLAAVYENLTEIYQKKVFLLDRIIEATLVQNSTQEKVASDAFQNHVSASSITLDDLVQREEFERQALCNEWNASRKMYPIAFSLLDFICAHPGFIEMSTNAYKEQERRNEFCSANDSSSNFGLSKTALKTIKDFKGLLPIKTKCLNSGCFRCKTSSDATELVLGARDRKVLASAFLKGLAHVFACFNINRLPQGGEFIFVRDACTGRSLSLNDIPLGMPLGSLYLQYHDPTTGYLLITNTSH